MVNLIKNQKYKAKSAMLSRKPRTNESDEFKTAVIALFEVNNPHKTGDEPTRILEFPNMEKVRVRNMNLSFYLEGNDMVINDLKSITIEIDEDARKIVLKAEQEQVESRKESKRPAKKKK
ncbi:MAG: hypothetical protein NT001_05110 [Candidatus Woesearchaeota archaeon]|nr:hypothetical protein [Candidatus Woesearchaeota archaeon]